MTVSPFLRRFFFDRKMAFLTEEDVSAILDKERHYV